MTLEEVGLTEEQVMQVRDRSLTEAYEVHDVGYEVIVARLEAHGFDVVDHGDDARHADEVLYGDGPDLAVFDGGELVAYIEIKCKENPEWFGRCNYRHFKEYVNFANEQEVPVFIWFALVDTEKMLLHRDGFFEIEGTEQVDSDVYDVTEDEVVFHEDDVYKVDDGLFAVDGSDVIGVRTGDTVVDDLLPNIHGNDVVCLDEDQLRSMPHFLHRIV